MPDIQAISAAVSSLKHAIDIARAMQGASTSLDEAEKKLELAKVIEALADTKMRLAEIVDLLQDQAHEISSLKTALDLKGRLVRAGNHYVETDDKGHAVDLPLCTHCWDAERKAIHILIRDGGESCPRCKTVYQQEPDRFGWA